MRAVTFREVGQVEVLDVPEPGPPRPGEALVRVTLSAICGSDLHIYHGHSAGDPGMVIGHEFTGAVAALGDGVRGLEVGQRVVAAFYTACGECAQCRAGWWSQCAERAVFGHGEPLGGGLGGAQAEYCTVPNPALNLVPIPDGVSDEQAIFVGDVLATGHFAAVRAQIRPGDTVAVIGAGPVGLMALMAAQLFGPARVLVVDGVAARLDLAAELGGVPLHRELVNPEVQVARMTGGLGADAVLECVGQPAAIQTAISCVRGGGVVSSVGVPAEFSGDFPYLEFWTRALTFRSGLANVHPYMRPLLGLIAAGRLHPERVVSHRMPMEDAAEAYRIFDRREATKIVLRP